MAIPSKIAAIVITLHVLQFSCASQGLPQINAEMQSSGQSSGPPIELNELRAAIQVMVQTRDPFAIDLIDAVYRDAGAPGFSEDAIKQIKNALELFIHAAKTSSPNPTIDDTVDLITYALALDAAGHDSGLSQLTQGLTTRLRNGGVVISDASKPQVGPFEYELQVDRLRAIGGESLRQPDAGFDACDQIGIFPLGAFLELDSRLGIVLIGQFIHIPGEEIAILEISDMQDIRGNTARGMLCETFALFGQCAAQRGASTLQVTATWLLPEYPQKLENNQWDVYSNPFMEGQPLNRTHDRYRKNGGKQYTEFADIQLAPFQCIDGLGQLANGRLPYRLTEFDADDFAN